MAHPCDSHMPPPRCGPRGSLRFGRPQAPAAGVSLDPPRVCGFDVRDSLQAPVLTLRLTSNQRGITSVLASLCECPPAPRPPPPASRSKPFEAVRWSVRCSCHRPWHCCLGSCFVFVCCVCVFCVSFTPTF